MTQVRWRCRFVSLWRQLSKFCHVISIKDGLQYQIRVACPYCQREKCSSHNQIACSHEDCLHLLELRQGVPLICKKKPAEEVLTVTGQEQWFSQIGSKVGSSEMLSLAVLLTYYISIEYTYYLKLCL